MNTKVDFILIILFYVIGDIVTTYLCLKAGYVEQNSLMYNIVMNEFWILLVAMKLMVVTSCYVFYRISVLLDYPIFWKFISLFIILIGILVTINNSLLYLKV